MIQLTRSPSVELLGGQAPPRVEHFPQVRNNAWEDVVDLASSFGLTLDPWQERVLQAAMGERSNGKWAVAQLGVSTPRQNGKTMLIVARILAGLLLFEERTIVVSAHRQDTSREVFIRLVNMIEDNPALEARVDFIARSEMREYIRMRDGAEVRFKARSSGSGRGFSCDCLLLDEAQILGAAAWSAILPTMSARPNPQVWLLGTPPTPQDDGEVFSRFRSSGLEGKESRLAYLEWSADKYDDMDDPETWAKANPAFGTRISHEAVAGERATMTDDQFAMERLGMWAGSASAGVLPAESWSRAADSDSIPVDRFALGVEVAPDLGWASVCLAGQREDGDWHIEVEEDQHTSGRGTKWLVPHLQHVLKKNPQVRTVVADVGGPIAALLEEKRKRWYFRGTSLEVTPVKVAELGTACARVLDGVVVGWLHHIDQPQLSTAALSAASRPLGDTGMWVWSRKLAESDITQIQAATLALHGAQAEKVKKPRVESLGRSSGNRTGGNRKAVLM